MDRRNSIDVVNVGAVLIDRLSIVVTANDDNRLLIRNA